MRVDISYSSVFKVIGWLLLVESLLLAFPLLLEIIDGEKDVVGFVIAVATALAAGVTLCSVCRFDRIRIRRREGSLLVCLVWIIFSLTGMLPFIFSSTRLSVTDAFFETMSGFTTTGATVIADVESMSRGLLLWRALTQWIGGLGIILFMLAILPSLNEKGGIQMYNAEVTGITHDKIHPRIRQTALALWKVYIVLTIVLVVLLWLGPMNLFDAVCQALTAISTGGFSTRNASIAFWNSDYVSVVLTFFMFVGGVNFSLIYTCIHVGVRPLLKNDVVRAYFLWVVLGAVLVSASLLLQGMDFSVDDILIYPLFHVVSTVTTTGFSLGDYQQWGEFPLLVTYLLMLSGACAGSTSGGIKVDRLAALRQNLCNEIKLTLSSNRVYVVRVNGNVLAAPELSKITAFITIYISLILLGSVLLTALSVDAGDSFFAVVSCIGNNGLGYGITGSAGGFYLLPEAGKWLMSAYMLIGRLELFSFLSMLFPMFWRK